jgi:hypothetical protein
MDKITSQRQTLQANKAQLFLCSLKQNSSIVNLSATCVCLPLIHLSPDSNSSWSSYKLSINFVSMKTFRTGCGSSYKQKQNEYRAKVKATTNTDRHWIYVYCLTTLSISRLYSIVMCMSDYRRGLDW